MDITMTEQPAQDRAASSRQMPDALHIDLPHVDPEEACFIIYKCFLQVTQHLTLMAEGVTCEMTSAIANFCMDIIQTFAETVLDVVMPQVYRYMRTYGTFSPTILGLTEDRIHAYLGDSIEQALNKCMKIEVQNFVSTKALSQLFVRHISKTVNSVLALSTRTPIQDSRLPVFFVSGFVTSIKDLRDMVWEIAIMLTRVLEDQLSQNSVGETSSGTVMDFVLHVNSIRDLKKSVKNYLIRMVKSLKGRAQMPYCDMSSSNNRNVFIRVGTSIRILTVEDSESHGPLSAMSSYNGLDAIPGAVPESNDSESHSESCPFSSVTVICATEDHSCRLSPDTIEEIADDLVEAFLEDLKGAAQTDSGGLGEELREVIDKIFKVVMHGHDYQIPLMPPGTWMCSTVTYRKQRRGGVTDPGLIAHALYTRTEEVINRCALQVLLWSALHSVGLDWLSSHSLDRFPDGLASLVVPRQAAGDSINGVIESSPTLRQESLTSSRDSNITYDVIAESLELTQSQLVTGIVHTSLLSLVVGEMLTVIGIRSGEMIFEVVKKVVEELQDVDPSVYDHFHASLMGRCLKDISQTAITDLLQEFGSVQVMQELQRSRDPSFEEAIIRALRKQLRISTSPVPHGIAAKKRTCSFFKKFKRLCCKKAGKTTTVASLTSGQDNSDLQDHLNEEEPLKDQRKQRQCPFIKWIAASTRTMCSSLRKMFSSVGRALGRPFKTCFSPERQ